MWIGHLAHKVLPKALSVDGRETAVVYLQAMKASLDLHLGTA